MHIVFVTTELATTNNSSGGLASFTANIARIFATKGHEVEIILVTTKEENLVFDDNIKIESVFVRKKVWNRINKVAKICAFGITEKVVELRKFFEGKYKCIFGAGLIGNTWAYDILKVMGFCIDFFCDNNKNENILIKDGIKTISLEKLYSLKDKVLVFIAVTDKYQDGIRLQLEKNGIYNIVRVDYLFLQNFINSLLSMNDEDIKKQFEFILNDEEYLSRYFEYRIGYRPNLNNPQSFNEKLQWMKLYDYKPMYTQLVDKYMAKQYVKERIGNKYLTPTLGIWDNFDDIHFDELPEKFVLKCTHDSGSMIVCKKKEEFNMEEARTIINYKLQVNYFLIGRERPYKDVERKIIAESFLENKNGEGIIDYKFLCANGKVKYVFTCSDRNTKKGLHVNFYKTDWTPLPFERHYHKRESEIKKPDQLGEMIGLAEKLAMGLKFVRVDFYLVDEKIYFSEFTFYPGGGMEEFTPEEWDYELGKMIEL